MNQFDLLVSAAKNLCFALTIVFLGDSWCDFPTQFDQCVTNYYNLSFYEHRCVFMQSELYSNFASVK